jgi:hypothetical protein
MTERLLIPSTLLAALMAGSCALALPGYNEPFEERIAVLSADPTDYTIMIEGSDQPAAAVPADGRVVLAFPVLPRHCSTYLLGVRLVDRSVEARDLVHFVREGRVVKRMSVNQLRRRPVDSLGFHKVDLK